MARQTTEEISRSSEIHERICKGTVIIKSPFSIKRDLLNHESVHEGGGRGKQCPKTHSVFKIDSLRVSSSVVAFFFAVPPCLPIAFVVEQLSPADSLSNWSRDGSVPPQMPLWVDVEVVNDGATNQGGYGLVLWTLMHKQSKKTARHKTELFCFLLGT